jgi:hypothetical protein
MYVVRWLYVFMYKIYNMYIVKYCCNTRRYVCVLCMEHIWCYGVEYNAWDRTNCIRRVCVCVCVHKIDFNTKSAVPMTTLSIQLPRAL